MFRFFQQSEIFLTLQIVVALGLFFFWVHVPPPGWAVALLAFAAAVMSVHPNMTDRQKFCWILLLGGLLVVELRAISKDRADAETKALKDRKQQDLEFQTIRTQQNTAFAGTADRLEKALSGISDTLKTARTTLLQTRPVAAIRFQDFVFANPVPEHLQPNTQYTFNFHYVDTGAEAARDIQYQARVYIGRADDLQAQVRLVNDFEKSWSRDVISIPKLALLAPGFPAFSSTTRSFHAEDLASPSANATIYLLVRFEYSDGSGRWRTDACESLQRGDKEVQTSVGHPCLMFNRSRYPTERNSLGRAHE